jgi:hyperosmotically inducible periplasmic protein
MRARHAWSLALAVVGLSLLLSCAATDTGITTAVKAKFAADDTVKASQIDVTTQDGIVTLTGNVDSENAKNKAIELARATKGVKNVVDMISAQTASGSGDAPDPNRTIGETVTDTGITMSVKTKLLEDELVKGLAIDVDTRDGVVYLTGKVRSEAEKEKAIQLAKDTNGVKDVQANLTLEKS